MPELKRTPLYSLHCQRQAHWGEFAGWEMPIFFTGILEEAKRTRQSAGLWDVSHMGRLVISGPSVLRDLEYLTPNNVEGLGVHRGHYTLLLNESAGILDDCILFRWEEEKFYLVVNAGNTDKDCRWIQSHLHQASLQNITGETCLLALQGPQAVSYLNHLLAESVDSLQPFAGRWAYLAGQPIYLTRTGYTGEDGFEIMVAREGVEKIWRLLIEAGGEGLALCGLGARDVLRIEAGYPLYGHEIDENHHPLEAGLGFVLKKTQGFIGAEALQKIQEQGLHRKLVGLRLASRSIARQGETVHYQGESVGIITSGTFSPHLSASIALAYVRAEVAKEGTEVIVESPRRQERAVVVPLPFFDMPRARRRR